MASWRIAELKTEIRNRKVRLCKLNKLWQAEIDFSPTELEFPNMRPVRWLTEMVLKAPSDVFDLKLRFGSQTPISEKRKDIS